MSSIHLMPMPKRKILEGEGIAYRIYCIVESLMNQEARLHYQGHRNFRSHNIPS